MIFHKKMISRGLSCANYLNDVNLTTFVVKMRTLIKNAYWNILKEFYHNKNTPLHLREISRKIQLDQSALTRHLNQLTKVRVLTSEKEGNLKKFSIVKHHIKAIYPLYDEEKLTHLPLLRKNAIHFYLQELPEKPVFALVFGSTAKGTFKEESDIDIITIFNSLVDTKKARTHAEAQTGITISEFQTTYKEFIKEVKLKKDAVIQSGIETGIPVYNKELYYEVLYE
jgi:predicted nucleotidyltransferase/DNA-binding transcriptional ArsR family regulator